MANGHDEFFLTLNNSFRGINLAKTGKNALLNYVYRQIEPEPRDRFASIKVNIFDKDQSGTVLNLAQGDPATYQTPHVDPTVMTLSFHAAYRAPIYSANLAKASAPYVEGVRDTAVKKLTDYANEQIAALVTPTNFNEYTPVDSGANADIPDTAMVEAWSQLAEADVPVGDVGNFFLVTPPAVYGNLTKNELWATNTVIGDDVAGIRRTARLGMQWGAYVDWDPDLGVYQSSAGVYKSILFHRHAMGLVSAPLPPPMDTGVPTSYVSIGGIPCRVTISWDDQYRRDALCFDMLFGVGVIRADHGILIANTP